MNKETTRPNVDQQTAAREGGRRKPGNGASIPTALLSNPRAMALAVALGLGVSGTIASCFLAGTAFESTGGAEGGGGNGGADTTSNTGGTPETTTKIPTTTATTSTGEGGGNLDAGPDAIDAEMDAVGIDAEMDSSTDADAGENCPDAITIAMTDQSCNAIYPFSGQGIIDEAHSCENQTQVCCDPNTLECVNPENLIYVWTQSAEDTIEISVPAGKAENAEIHAHCSPNLLPPSATEAQPEIDLFLNPGDAGNTYMSISNSASPQEIQNGKIVVSYSCSSVDTPFPSAIIKLKLAAN